MSEGVQTSPPPQLPFDVNQVGAQFWPEMDKTQGIPRNGAAKVEGCKFHMEITKMIKKVKGLRITSQGLHRFGKLSPWTT